MSFLLQYKRWIILVLLLIGAGVGWWFWEQRRGEGEWREYAEAARKRGVRLTMPEMFPEPEPVPPGQNYADTPLWRRVFSASGDADEIIPVLPWTKLMPNRKPGFKEVRVTLIEEKWLPREDTQDDDAEAILRGLKKLEKPLAELHAVSDRPRAQFPDDWRSFPLQAPHAVPALRLGQALQLKARACLQLGQVDEAASAWKDGLALAKVLESTPSALAALTSASIMEAMLQVLDEGVTAKRWNDAQLQDFGQALHARNFLTQYHTALAAERAAFNTGVEPFLASRNVYHLLGWPAGQKMNISTRIRVRNSAWWRRNQIRLNQVFDEVSAKFDIPSQRVFAPELQNENYGGTKNPEESGYNLFAGLAGSPSLASRAAYVHTLVRMGELVCALERFRSERGNNPEMLEALVPQYLDDLPRDPCASGTFKYRLREDGTFQLYSVGLNREDEQGRTGGTKESPAKQLDWPWPPFAE